LELPLPVVSCELQVESYEWELPQQQILRIAAWQGVLWKLRFSFIWRETILLMMTRLFLFIALAGLITACGTTAPVVPDAPTITTAAQPLEEDDTFARFSCEHNGTLSSQQLRDSTVFGRAAKVQVVAFSNKVVTALPVEKNRIVYKYIKETITLTEEQTDSLTDLFYNYNYSDTLTSKGSRHGLCYFPRHAVVLLDSLNRILSYFEVCFECENYKIRPEKEHFGEFCIGKYDLLEAGFRSFGITFFHEEEEGW
jgi:hypothetical protein